MCIFCFCGDYDACLSFCCFFVLLFCLLHVVACVCIHLFVRMHMVRVCVCACACRTLNDDSPLGLRRILSQSTDSLNFRSRTMSMESLNDEGKQHNCFQH